MRAIASDMRYPLLLLVMPVNEDEETIGWESYRCYVEYHKANNTQINYITQDMFSTHQLHDVPMPHDGSIKRSWNVAHIVLPQIIRLDEVNKSNASTSVSPEVLASCKVYSWRRIHKAADVLRTKT